MSYRTLGVVCALALAMPASAAGQNRGWIDFSLAATAAADGEYDRTLSLPTVGPLFQEDATYDVTYRYPTALSFDVGGGVMVTPLIGVGIHVSRSVHSDTPVVSVRLPHPFILNSYATGTASDTLADLEREQLEVDIRAVVPVWSRDQFHVRLFAGPSYFGVEQEVVLDIHSTHNFVDTAPTPHSVTVDRIDLLRHYESAWGFHVGGDFAMFFTEYIGAGAFLKYARSSVDLIDFSSFTNEGEEVSVGGLTFGAGLRLRF